MFRLELFRVPGRLRRKFHLKPPAKLVRLHLYDAACKKSRTRSNFYFRALCHWFFRFEHRAMTPDLFQIDDRIRGGFRAIVLSKPLAANRKSAAGS